MTQVTIGVPVYNGADYLEKCLSCLRDQTYRDIEVLIFDNCSEDATGEIAQRFCAEDARFRYHRHAENKGALRNFLEVLEAAQSPFFMWRAADDVSDLNYVEVLLTLLITHPDRDFAVPRILSVLPDGSIAREYPISPRIEWKGAAGRLAQLFLSNNGWFYGLARREALTRSWRQVFANFPMSSPPIQQCCFPLRSTGNSSERTTPPNMPICAFLERARTMQNAWPATRRSLSAGARCWRWPNGMWILLSGPVWAPVLSPCGCVLGPQVRGLFDQQEDSFRPQPALPGGQRPAGSPDHVQRALTGLIRRWEERGRVQTSG